MGLKEAKHLLFALNFMNAVQRRDFFRRVTKAQLRPLEEACLNLLKNPSTLSDEHLATARKYKRVIKILSDRSESFKTKKLKLVQKGGFITALLPVLASLIGSFLSR